MLPWFHLSCVFFLLVSGEAKESCKSVSDCRGIRKGQPTTCFQNECLLVEGFKCKKDSECLNNVCTQPEMDASGVCTTNTDGIDCKKRLCPYCSICVALKQESTVTFYML